MLLLALAAPLASATPLDLSKPQAITLIHECESGNAGACRSMAAAARRAWAASVVDNAWGNDEVARYRYEQAMAFARAACQLGDTLSCHDVGERTAACADGDQAACDELKRLAAAVAEAPPRGRPVIVTDSAGIPLAGLDTGGRAPTDLGGRGDLPRRTIGGYHSGLESLVEPAGDTITIRSLGEKRARGLAIAPGLTLTASGQPSGVTSTDPTTGRQVPLEAYLVTAIDPDSPWAKYMQLGSIVVPGDKAPGMVGASPLAALADVPSGGWTAEGMWAAAGREGPAHGVLAVVDNQFVELPGRGECMSRTAAAMYATAAGATPSSGTFDVLCPDPAAVGTHVKSAPARRWEKADLVRWLDGTWQPSQPLLDRLDRIRARVLAGAATASGDPAEDIEVSDMLGILKQFPGQENELLDVWFSVSEERAAPLTVSVSGTRKDRTVTWDGAPATVEVGAGMVRIRAGQEVSRVIFVDHDTIVVGRQVYIRG